MFNISLLIDREIMPVQILALASRPTTLSPLVGLPTNKGVPGSAVLALPLVGRPTEAL